MADLIYYWNRLLYEGDNAIYLTVEELNLLSGDKFFGGVLHDISNEDVLSVVSLTLDEEEVQELIKTKLNPIAFYRRFVYKNVSAFPFDILDSKVLYEKDYGESPTTQVLTSTRGLFHVPPLSFSKKVAYNHQRWAIDVEIKEDVEVQWTTRTSQNLIKYPSTTDTRSVFRQISGRVKQDRDISIFIDNQQNAFDTLEITMELL